MLSELEARNDDKEISYFQEAARKLVHVFSLVIPILYFFTSRSTTLLILLPACVLSIAFDLIRFTGHDIWNRFLVKYLGFMLRPTEKIGFSGASYILTTDFLVILMFDKAVAISAIAFIVLGDASAALIGRRWGFHKYGNKSIEGSLAFFISAALAAYGFHLIYGDAIPYIVGLSGALVATLVEAFTTRSDDNMTVPIVSGLYMQAFLAFI